jgi:transcription initiation factor TFIIIB Brf1 subunit/transcription initiation factor TFIIB
MKPDKEKLAIENTKWRPQNQQFQDYARRMERDFNEYAAEKDAEIKRLRAEIERLRAALKEAARVVETEGMHYAGLREYARLREGAILDRVAAAIRALIPQEARNE